MNAFNILHFVRTLANHAIFKAVRSLELFLPKSVRDLEQKFAAFLLGTKQRPPRWTECISHVSNKFEVLISALYVRKYFSEETRQAAVEMVADIKDEMVNIIKKTDWMDESTRKLAVEKALTIKTFVGYPSELLDDKKLEEFNANLFINSDNFLRNFINVSIFSQNSDIKFFMSPLNNSDWRSRMTATMVNAAYLAHENSIQIPAVTLQNIFFNKDRLKALNYGAIGYIIGHEFTHGFDDQGKQFNKDGIYENWWAENTNKAFLERAQCIIDQYSNYIVLEVNETISGIKTQGENIADGGGLKEAYLAYISWIKRNSEERKLPGLKYTPKQLFWISAANTWCTSERPESLKSDILQDDHSPSEFRVVGPLSNSEYFSADFNCPSNSKMNPKHKCQVW